jgi:hypothetical protein
MGHRKSREHSAADLKAAFERAAKELDRLDRE